MDIKIAQQETITELVLENQKLKQERDEARHKLELCMAANSDVARIAKERDEARGLLASEKITRDHIIKRGIEMQKERDEAEVNAAQLADRLSGLELRTTEELARLEQSRDEWSAMCGRYKQERDETQKKLSSIHQWIERNHPDGFIDSLTYLQNLDRVTDNWYDRIDAIEIDARRFVRERDEAREQVNHYRDKLDLSPISWDI